MLADSRTEAYAARCMIRDAARRYSAGENVSMEASCCKYFASEMRSEEHTSELQSLMRISYAVFCLKKKTTPITTTQIYLSLTRTPCYVRTQQASSTQIHQ